MTVMTGATIPPAADAAATSPPNLFHKSFVFHFFVASKGSPTDPTALDFLPRPGSDLELSVCSPYFFNSKNGTWTVVVRATGGWDDDSDWEGDEGAVLEGTVGSEDVEAILPGDLGASGAKGQNYLFNPLCQWCWLGMFSSETAQSWLGTRSRKRGKSTRHPLYYNGFIMCYRQRVNQKKKRARG